MPQLAITGCTGFVGRRLLRAALDRGHRVQAWELFPEKLEHIDSPNLQVVPWDARKGVEQSARLAECDAMIHLAAYIPSDYDRPENAPNCFGINTLATLELLEACAQVGVDRFVYTSSGNVYRPGGTSGNLADEEAPKYPSERAPYYLASKLSAEIFVDHFRQSGQIPSTAMLRPSGIYGPGMRGGVVDIFARRLVDGEPIQVADGGRHGVDLVWVDDVADAMLAAAETDADGPFNVGSGRRCTVRELAESLQSICDAPDELVEIKPADGDADDTSGFAALDITRARRALGYEPTPLDEGLRQLVAYLR